MLKIQSRFFKGGITTFSPFFKGGHRGIYYRDTTLAGALQGNYTGLVGMLNLPDYFSSGGKLGYQA